MAKDNLNGIVATVLLVSTITIIGNSVIILNKYKNTDKEENITIEETSEYAYEDKNTLALRYTEDEFNELLSSGEARVIKQSYNYYYYINTHMKKCGMFIAPDDMELWQEFEPIVDNGIKTYYATNKYFSSLVNTRSR